MKYFDELDEWLDIVLWPQEEESEPDWFARVTTQLKKKILESYRNGQKAPKRADAEEQPREPHKKKSWPSRRDSHRQ